MIIALILDYSLGDPAWAWHPVRALGRLISKLETWCRTVPVSVKAQGALFLALNMAAFIAPVALICSVSSMFGNLRAVADGVLVYFALGGTCLAREVEGVAAALGKEGPPLARVKLRMLVSRDVDGMNENSIASSAIETLAENFSDSAVATLFYAALGGAPFAWIHRVSNTLDAMVGYKTDEYAEFGYASAKLDDVLNFIPARLSVVMVALASICSNAAADAVSRARGEGRSLPSPNSGYPIAAFAGALGVKLCGPVKYFGVLKDKPFIGRGPRPDVHDVERAIFLYWNSYAVSSAVFLLMAYAMSI
jgi:adenosylcobinamide-phosphate synthase